jgi:hypothetical protein
MILKNSSPTMPERMAERLEKGDPLPGTPKVAGGLILRKKTHKGK